MNPIHRRDFVIRLSTVAAALSAGAVLSACGGDDAVPQFLYGVASGDPLADRVILWTHARYPDSDVAVDLNWEVASDNGFADIVKSGTVTATAATGFTAKVDASGLTANTEYFYRFRQGQHASAVGRARTLPTGSVSEVRLAVLSCANYPAGFFNVYAEVAKSDAQFALHLGDYIYEYAAGGYASANADKLGRVVQPANELLTLADYRLRHAQYRSDPDAKDLHARLPMIAVWDDHEIANDSYQDGAENHDPAKEGSFAARRAAALQAWHEWMPVRSGADQGQIYRSFDFGNLLSLHMLDTRLVGRDQQVTIEQLLNPATQASALAALSSPTRQLLGQTQLQWLQGQMSASKASWQVLGQQVLMARMTVPLSILNALNPANTSPTAVADGAKAVTDYLTAKATPVAARTPAQQALLNPAINPELGYNLDAWDGYPAAREYVLGTAAQLGKKLVVLAGDTHNAWHSSLTLMDGRKVGEEFATSSVSSPGLENYLAALPPEQVKFIFENVIDDLDWMDPKRRGFLKMTFTASAAKGEWVFVDRIDSRSYAVDAAAGKTLVYQPGLG
ncbi:alkaline phosphatase D family protein [Malikia spinosa]|uniref:Alkaline phosphatase n=1 Tax=Malikia spinosa TaxID=86180 RepID=A0A7C9MX38_9BURK|nr:alkaline phosphatase D family protein [Malikia spinosa]MYZ53436.1 alkaline phosphatase [Malikia spinosa]